MRFGPSLAPDFSTFFACALFPKSLGGFAFILSLVLAPHRHMGVLLSWRDIGRVHRLLL
jgi:hypothetical protein